MTDHNDTAQLDVSECDGCECCRPVAQNSGADECPGCPSCVTRPNDVELEANAMIEMGGEAAVTIEGEDADSSDSN